MIISVDVGTSSARASAYAADGNSVHGLYHQVPYEPRVTGDGGVEHDPRALLAAVGTCLDAVCARAGRATVRGVGVSTFWHGLCGFDASGNAITPVYMWADSRSARDAALLGAALDETALHARTGCHLHSSYWPAKLRWFAREHPGEMRRVARWGSFGEHLELTMFGEAATSVSMASATGLFDVATGSWDAEALAAAGIEPRQLFRVVDRGEGRRGLRPEWAARWPALHAVPWFPAVGDGAAGNVGSDCIATDRIALNVGTSAALRVATDGSRPTPRGLWRYGVDRRHLLLGGATSEGGNVYAWCRETLRLPDDATLERRLDAMPPDSHGLTVLPFLAGERAPGWRVDRRGAVTGLSLDTGALEIVRAALEAVALRLALVYRLLAPYAAREHAVVASGGAVTRSRAWTRMLADALGHPVTWSHEPEATSRGAALLAWQALGAVPDLAAVRAPLGETFEPEPARHARYQEALERQRALDERV
jgi:gluconokinase